ncbi:hypothetical protein L7F22_004857 [Adiantum nelumboides]|nr:hypothetical protein [Adiantum nelumboides]
MTQGFDAMDIDGEELGSQAAITRPLQVFDYLVVLDFEATCDESMETIQPQEIIEFPSVLLDCRTLTLGDRFQTYVRPHFHPILTPFCKHLTGIQQEQVDKGISLQEAIHRHDQWLEHKGIKGKKFAILIWGDWDCKFMLNKECKLKGLYMPEYFNRWINLKLYASKGRRCGLREAVEAFGLNWTGRAHCGLDDATNTAKLASELMRQGIILTTTGSLHAQRPKYPDAQANWQSTGESSNSLSLPMLQCYCGETCKRQMVKEVGSTSGNILLVCRKWTPTQGNGCGFFAWDFS